MAPAASTVRDVSALECAQRSPAEAEPWGDEGGGQKAPATRPTWRRRTLDRIKHSVWAKLGLKTLGLTLGMLALSGVGAWSLTSSARGVEVPLANMLGANVRAPWLSGQSPNAASAGSSANPSSVASANLGAVGATLAPAMPAPASTLTASASPTANGEPTRDSGEKPPGLTDDGKVILNLASVAELRHLPGVGQKRADAIVALRTRLGRFKQINDLLRVKGIGVRGLRRLLPHVVLDAPKPSA